MALINNNYVFVDTEELAYGAEISSHPIETGEETSDHIRKTPLSISIAGKIVNSGNKKASTILSNLKKLQLSGSLITYKGRNVVSNLQIADFSTGHPNTVWGGCTFSMTLQEVKIAKAAYVAPKEETGVKSVGTQKTETFKDNDAVYYTVKSGDTIWGLVWQQGYDKYNPQCPKDAKVKMIIHGNPHAFSRYLDPRTLQVGKVLLMGYKNSHARDTSLNYKDSKGANNEG